MSSGPASLGLGVWVQTVSDTSITVRTRSRKTLRWSQWSAGYHGAIARRIRWVVSSPGRRQYKGSVQVLRNCSISCQTLAKVLTVLCSHTKRRSAPWRSLPVAASQHRHRRRRSRSKMKRRPLEVGQKKEKRVGLRVEAGVVAL